jgi:hypothetical protein
MRQTLIFYHSNSLNRKTDFASTGRLSGILRQTLHLGILRFISMREWAGAAQKFLGPWTERSDFEGALVSGSYAVGLPDTHSDIDIMIVLSDRVRFWERGNRDIDGFLIEYLADPDYFWERTFNDEYTAGRKISINMFAW